MSEAIRRLWHTVTCKACAKESLYRMRRGYSAKLGPWYVPVVRKKVWMCESADLQAPSCLVAFRDWWYKG